MALNAMRRRVQSGGGGGTGIMDNIRVYPGTYDPTNRLSGLIIEGSNTSNNSGFTTIYTVPSSTYTATYNSFSFSNSTRYEWLRARHPSNYIDIVEIEFRRGTIVFTGTPFDSGPYLGDSATYGGQNAFDSNTSTSCVSYVSSGGYVGLDIGTSTP